MAYDLKTGFSLDHLPPAKDQPTTLGTVKRKEPNGNSVASSGDQPAPAGDDVRTGE